LLATSFLCAAASDRSYEVQNELPAHIQPSLSPPLSPEEALKSFQLEAGFEIELVAAEPLVEDPILMEWDLFGRLWVCEMRGFMLDVNATGELDEVGRIAVLEDSNQDGSLDKVTHFTEGLVLPRAMRVFQEGVLVGEHDKLWFYPDADNDLVPEDKVLVDAEYATTGSVEHRANGLLIGLDNWIYNSNSEKRYKRVDGEWIIEATEKRGQWGITQDDYGRMYYNFHWSQLHADTAPPSATLQNPNFTPKLSSGLTVTTDQRVFPTRMNTSVNRGYRDGILDNEGKLVRFASACSPWVYRGGTFPSTYNGNVFVCGPGANIVKRTLITDHGLRVSAINAYPDREFLASTDERFRPVSFAGGPDGSLHIVDMYRGVIQQADFITTYLRKDVIARKLEQPVHYGRIFRICSTGSSPTDPINFQSLSTLEWVNLLTHSNAWMRDHAQQWLVWKKPDEAIAPLNDLANGKNVLAAIHALWTLSGMKQDTFRTCLNLIPKSHNQLSITARTLATAQANNKKRTDDLVTTLEKQFPENEALSFHTLLALSKIKKTEEAKLTKDIVSLHMESPYIREALISGLNEKENDFLNAYLHDSTWLTPSPGKQVLLQDLAATVVRSKDSIGKAHLFQFATGSDWKAQAIKEGLLVALIERDTPLTFPKNPGLKDSRFLPYLQWPGHNPASASEARALSSAEKQLFVVGQAIYGNLCAACHGSDGKGLMSLGPPLARSKWVTGDPERLAKILLNGLEGEIEVNGKIYAPPEILPAMPPIGMMSDTEIAATITYIRRSWGHTADPVTRGDITRVRDTTMAQMGAWKVEQLLSVSE